jgi:hypothetical protein
VQVQPPIRRTRALGVEALEVRCMPAASLIAYDSLTGAWKAIALDADGQPAVSSATRWDPYGLTAVVQGDFNGDDQPDVAGWCKRGDWIVGLGGASQYQPANWLRAFEPKLNWHGFLVGDFNDDGRDDVAMFAPSAGWYVARSTGDAFQMARWSEPAAWRSPAGWRQSLTGDFNGDGIDDIVAINFNGGLQVAISTGDSFATQSWLTNGGWGDESGWRELVASDFNRDGKADIAGFTRNGQWWFAVSTGSAFHAAAWAAGLPGGAYWRSFDAGDFDGDGYSDVVTLSRTGDIWMFTPEGNRFIAHKWATAATRPGAPVRLTAGDFNGDGLDDVAIVSASGTCDIALSDAGDFALKTTTNLGQGRWLNSFASDRREPDSAFKHHRPLRPQSSRAFITPEDMAALRKDPAVFAALVPIYKNQLVARLGPVYGGLNANALAFSMATVVAYQAAYYRGANDPQGWFPRPKSYSLSDLLAVRKLQCREYATLADELYRIAFPAESDPDTSLKLVRFTRSPFATHSQLFFTNNGVALLGDPTVSLIVFADLNGLLAGQRIPGSTMRQLMHRPELTAYMEENMDKFKARLYPAIKHGGYKRVRIGLVLEF